MAYDTRTIEERWQKRWRDDRIFNVAEDHQRPKYYCVEMLPYPSGRIHVGHIRNYSIGDANCWFRRLQGYNVMHAIGWDAMGLPAENAAIKNGVAPAEWTYSNIRHMRETLQQLGFSYDWDREIASCHPGYYKWNQWFFLKLLEHDMAYRARRTLNWCPKCNTVLANEQVTPSGCCWRHEETLVQKVELDQWFVRTTKYADRLLEGLQQLEGHWPDRVLAMQRNWIGRSEGCRFTFKVDGSDKSIEVFSTRVDTVFGCSAVVIAAAHPLARELAAGTGCEKSVDEFIRSEAAAPPPTPEEEREKLGVFSGRYAVNPFNEEKVPIWLANFVLMDFGTGAVFCQPAHDQRDFEFARKYGLTIRPVVRPGDAPLNDAAVMEAAFTDDGVLEYSGLYSGLSSARARRQMASDAALHRFGSATVQFRLRDWGISRQRYWGTPIPVIYCDQCGIVPVPESELPVLLPDVANWKEAVGSPLAQNEAFVSVPCPKCGHAARRETDTMDKFVDSSWYFLRYLDPRNERAAFDRSIADYWMPIDQYIGGVEHAVGHLIYARFWTMFLRDIGLLSASEPAAALFTQGMVCGRSYRCPTHDYVAPTDVAGTLDAPQCPRCDQDLVVRIDKVSKSKLNAPDSDVLIARYGADAVRMFSLFGGPPVKDLEWSDAGIEGCSRFLQRIVRAVERFAAAGGDPTQPTSKESEALVLRRRTHRTIVRVTRDLGEEFQHNTAIAALMELVNEIYRCTEGKEASALTPALSAAVAEALDVLVRLLVPFAPHLAEEMNERLGSTQYLANRKWPEADPSLLIDDEVELPVQVLGKLRGQVRVARGADQEIVLAAIRADATLAKQIEGKELIRVVLIPDRLVNLVVRA